jgi:hypothetical protein
MNKKLPEDFDDLPEECRRKFSPTLKTLFIGGPASLARGDY